MSSLLDQSGFDRWAGSYDESIGNNPTGYPFEGYYRVLEFVRRQLGESVRNLRILDLGIGTGLLTQRLYDEGAAIVGLDFSAEMLRQAEEKMPSGEFLLHDLTKPLPRRITEDSFDFVVSSYAVHHLLLVRLVELILESLPLLCVGGKLLFADVGFLSQSDLNHCRRQNESHWDDAENYLVAEELLKGLRHSGTEVNARYTQLSSCAGVLTVLSTK